MIREMKLKVLNIRFSITILIVLFNLHCISVEAQTIRFQYLTSEDGISQSEVYAFLHDSRGFMWIGTLDGLNRYDGYNIEIFNTDRNDPHSLSNNTIRSLVEDKYGRVWIGTNDGLNYYDPATELIYQVNLSPQNTNFGVWSLYIKDDNLLIGTNTGLWTTSIAGEDIESIESGIHKIKFFSKNQDADSLIRSIIPSKYGGLWIQSSDNVSRVAFQEYSDELVVLEDLSLNFSTSQIGAIEDHSGNLWLASDKDGLARYNPKTKATVFFKDKGTINKINSNKCSALSIDKKGNLWVGSLDRGLSFASAESLNNEIVQFTSYQNNPSNPNSLNSNLIYSLYVSDDDILWVGTIGSGVNIYNPEQKKFHHYKFYRSSDDEPSSNFIRSVFVDKQNNLWVGTHNDGLYIMNPESGRFNKLGFESQIIFHMANYFENKNLVCTGNGIFLVEYLDNSLKIHSSNNNEENNNNAVFNVIRSKEGIYWFASLTGVGRIRMLGDSIFVDEFYSIDTDPAISIGNSRVLHYCEGTNEIIIGTEGGGLNIMSLDENHYPTKIDVFKKNDDPRSISSNYIRAIISDSKQNIWIGTYEGLNLMIRDSVNSEISFKTYDINDGLPNNMIQLLVEDDNLNLWIGTNGGLSKFIPSRQEFVNYTVNDGIQSNEFSEHTVYKKPDGEIIVGGINGINTFYPDEIKNSTINPNTTITGFYISNEKVKPLQKVGRKAPLDKSIVLTDAIKLLPKQKNIGFEFSSMIYPNASEVKYAYKLEGFEDEWQTTDATNRVANYTNLRHGKYRFLVKSTNADGMWGSPEEISLHILTPFKFTWFAYVLYVLIIVLIFTYFSLRYTTKRKLLLEREHAEKLHNLDELRMRFFINISHDLRTPLTLITGPLDKLLKKTSLKDDIRENLHLIKRNVKRLNYLVEQLLDVRKSEGGILKPKLQLLDLVSFTREETAHFTYAVKKKGIKMKIASEADKLMVKFDPGMISKVYFNILSNAIKFTDNGLIEIRIDRIDKENFEILRDSDFTNYVRVEIRDTGRGISEDNKQKIFERFYQDQSQTEYGYGIGLSHSKELVDAHQGFIEVESEEGSGTLVRFFLPDTELLNEIQNQEASSTEDIFVDIDNQLTEGEVKKKNSAKTILILEDNMDMRSFIASELQSQYNILQASDGVEGLYLAENHSPDLIVSDIMMPNMDGIEFCEKIKSNIKTSHIPIILLTAKVEQETKYKGIETGADDFIPKPFEIEYLVLRIKNLLHSRDELRKMFQKSGYLEPSAVTVTSIDEKFLLSLKQAIEQGMSNAEFSITSLESEMGMSHANFYRKIKGLTGQSGQELLQNMRMKRAHQILSEKKGIRIAEVAYMVGFTNPKYFSKCFKETFGYAPSELK